MFNKLKNLKYIQQDQKNDTTLINIYYNPQIVNPNTFINISINIYGCNNTPILKTNLSTGILLAIITIDTKTKQLLIHYGKCNQTKSIKLVTLKLNVSDFSPTYNELLEIINKSDNNYYYYISIPVEIINGSISYYNKKLTNKFPIDVSKTYIDKLLQNNIPATQLYITKLVDKNTIESKVPWDFNILSQEILDKIPKEIYSWYHEITSDVGNSTIMSKKAYSDVPIKPNYLNPNKLFSLSRELNLYSKDLGKSTFIVNCPFFTVPYGCASNYGGMSDDLSTLLGTVKADGIYTIPMLSKYTIERHAKEIKNNSKNEIIFFMFQIYITNDDDINISIIERAKECGVSVIILTIDRGSYNHGGILLSEYQADLTYSRFCYEVLFNDPIFNIKCYQENNCIGTTDGAILNTISQILNISTNKLLEYFDYTKSLDYAQTIMNSSNISSSIIEHIAKLCHSNKSLSKYIKKNITKGVPLVVKGCLTKENALLIQESNADGVYVSNHGGRFFYNSIPPLNVVTEIRDAVKKNNKDFGVWLDGGIRNGGDILTAYAKGAEFVGVGRPIIYACVLYGEAGVSSITKKMTFELNMQAIQCGLNNLNDYNIIKTIL